jgi:hypothetical protein
MKAPPWGSARPVAFPSRSRHGKESIEKCESTVKGRRIDWAARGRKTDIAPEPDATRRDALRERDLPTAVVARRGGARVRGPGDHSPRWNNSEENLKRMTGRAEAEVRWDRHQALCLLLGDRRPHHAAVTDSDPALPELLRRRDPSAPRRRHSCLGPIVRTDAGHVARAPSEVQNEYICASPGGHAVAHGLHRSRSFAGLPCLAVPTIQPPFPPPKE